jgi:lipoprotein NlpD
MKRIVGMLIVAAVLSGCASSGSRAPVVEARSAVSKPVVKRDEVAGRVHIVQKGDTLYGIAFSYGLDPRVLAEQNGILDHNLIQVGQQIVLSPAPPHVENKPAPVLPKEQPKLVKYAYSEAVIAKIESVQGESGGVSKPETKAKIEAKTAVKTELKTETKSDTAKSEAKPEVGDGADGVEWAMPAQGKVVGRFSEADNSKGIDIAGKLGQSIFASASGKVVYSGSGLRGYGKLLIIKHNKTYLSAYAHNDKLLVKEGDNVTRGQKIAEMGNSDSEQVKLHFEVRRLGKPVDPANYLPLNKS